MKITELRQQYPDLFPEFETEADRAAYELEQDAAAEARVAAKVAELKALYAANPAKYPKFKAFTTEDDWADYAKLVIKQTNTAKYGTLYKGLQNNFSEENASWEQFSYVEILAMESNGVCVPAEVLTWAHSMQDSDVTAYEIGDDAEVTNDLEGTGEDSANSELQKMQKKTQTLSEKSATAKNEASLKFNQFKEISKKAEKIQKEQETSKKDALKQIGDLTKEYEELQDKAKNGSELTDVDKKRYVELGKMLNGKDGELITNVQTSSDELQDLINSMDGLNKDAIEGIDLGEDTVDMAEQLALYEKGYKSKNTMSGLAMSMITGELKDWFFGGKGKTIARDALDNGNNLIEFSNTLTNQLMMNQYLSLYNFAGEFNANATETIDATKETMGEDFNKSGEEFEEEAEVPEEQENEELSMDGLTTMGLGTRKLTKKVQEVSNDSAQLAKEAKKELKKLGKEQSELAEEKEAIVEEKQQSQVDEAETQTEKTNEPEKALAAQESAKPVSIEDDNENSGEITAEAKAEEVDGKIETNNEKGLTVQEKLQKSLKTNEKYDKFNDKANDVMDKTCTVGTVSVLYGTNLIVGGTQMITIGTPLLASIFTYPAGVALITQGTITLTAGVGFVGLGADLIAIGTEGVEATDITGEQIDVTDITIQEALEAIEQQEGTGEGEEQLTAAQSERQEMIESGATLEEQAKHFRDRSREEKSNSVRGIIETKLVKAESEKEANKSEKTAKVIEFTMKGKKAEYDELAEKKEEAEKEQKRLEKQMQNPSSIHRTGNVEKNEVDFTEQDEQKMDKLEKQLKAVGNKGQQNLLQSLEKVEGLSEFLADKDETALTTIDYGDVTQIVGQELIDSNKGHFLLLYKMILGLSTRNTGEAASETGTILQEITAAAINTNEESKSRINVSQTKVEDVTMSPALSVAATSDEEQNEESNSNQDNSNKKESEADVPYMTNRMIATQNSKATNAPQKQTSNSQSNSAGINVPDKASASDVSKTKKMGQEVNEGAKESEGFATDAKRDEKTIEKETKTTIKLFNKDQKRMNKIVKETDALVKEQEALLVEFEQLQLQNEEIQTRLQAKQNSKPVAINNNKQQNEQGGLLSQGNGVLAGQSDGLLGGQDTNQEDTKTLEANNARLTIISTRFVKIKETVQKNQTSVKNIQKTSKSRYKKINKLIREKDKLVKQRQKAEADKQKKLARQLAFVGVFSNVFSITLSIGTAMCLWPPTAAAGAVLVKIGTEGVATCAVVKASILIANGQLGQALMCLGQAAIQVAMSYVSVPGVSSATTKMAQQVIGTVSASLMAVSSTAEMAANIQVASGGEASGWLQTVSSVAGAAGALTGVANGIANGLSGSTFNKVAQVASMSGTVLTSGVQIANLVGEDSKFTQILALVGAGMATAGAVMNLAGKATGIDKAKEQKVEETQNTDNTNNTDNKSDEATKKETEKKAQEADNAQKEENKKAANDAKKAEVAIQAVEQQVTGVDASSEQMPVDQKIAEIDNKVQEISTSETAQEIENFDANQQNSEVDEIVADENLETDKKAEANDNANNTDKADETKKDEADNKVATDENNKTESEEEKQTRLEKEEKAAKKAAKQEKMKKVTDIIGNVGEAASQGLTLVQGLTKEEQVEPTKKKYNGPHSNIKKGASLMKNIKKRKMKSAATRKFA